MAYCRPLLLASGAQLGAQAANRDDDKHGKPIRTLEPRAELLTRRPRGFKTLGFREKCMWMVPSSSTLTATFLSVLFPQWGQKSRVISDVVLEESREARSAG